MIPADVFERHGIAHLSPSSINAWISNPSFWVAERLFGHKIPVGPAAIRGRAAEAGICHKLMTPSASIDDCVAHALAIFDREIAFARASDDAAAERADVAAYVAAGIAELVHYGPPTPPPTDNRVGQHKVEMRLPGIGVPVIGYLDLRYDDLGGILDIKTTARRPSRISPAHGRQGAIYGLAESNYWIRFAYVLPGVPKPAKVMPQPRAVWVFELTAEEKAYHYRTAYEAAMRLGRFLSLSKDRAELAALLMPDYEQFHWNSPAALDAGLAVFGF